MNKFVPVSSLAIVVASVSFGGVYLSGRGGSGTDAPPAKKTFKEIKFAGLQEFKSGGGGECVEEYMKPINLSDPAASTIGANDNIDGNYFASATSEEAKSCLVINWERTDSSASGGTNKWTGEFKWIWTFVRGNKGMVSFNFYKPSKKQNQLDLEGGIYFADKNETNGNWEVKKYRDLSVGGAKEITVSDFPGVFPRPGDAIKAPLDQADANRRDHWGFVSGGGDLNGMCRADEANCPSDPANKTVFKESWVWSGSEDGIEMNKWAKDIYANLSSIYGTNGLSLSGAFSSFKGVWNRQ